MLLTPRYIGAAAALSLSHNLSSCPRLRFLSTLALPTVKMSGRSNSRGAARSGSRGGGRGRGGRQRWWDPAWRAQRLSQFQVAVEVMDKSEWGVKLEEFNRGGEQEMLIKKHFSRDDQDTLARMAAQLGLYFHAYNKGKTLLVSKVPLPSYRADLDEHHGSTQNEIRVSSEIERRVGNLLESSKSAVVTDMPSSSASSQNGKLQFGTFGVKEEASVSQNELAKQRISRRLKERQESMKTSDSARAMFSFREKLPAFKVKDDFLKAVASHQVLVVSGETGCGKTTQLPQFILEEEISSLCGADCNIICTQPRRIAAISVAARISAERGERLGDTVGYQIRLEAKRSAETRLLFCTTGVLLRQLVQDPDLTGVSHILVDEIHERGMNEDFLLIILKDLLSRRQDLRVILMSATINADLFSQYFGNAPVIHIKGFTYPVVEFFLEDVLEKTSYRITPQSNTSAGDFTRRRKLAESRKDALTELWNQQLSIFVAMREMVQFSFFSPAGMIFLSYLTALNPISFWEILESSLFFRFMVQCLPSISVKYLTDLLQMKIVLATNVAESSITIDDIVYVIDCGKAKGTSYDALNKIACLLPTWISKASAHQRRGRAGRVQAGVCYRLYPKVIHDAMAEYELPEILRTPLQELCLHIKGLKLGAIASFLAKALQPPDALAVWNAIELLKTIGAMDDSEELTPLGRHLCALPLDPNIGKMLLMGSIFQCLSPASTIAAALAHRNPFVLPLNKKEEADAAKRAFAGDSCSDHIAVLNAFKGWKAAKRRGGDRPFCWQNYLSPMTLQMMDDMQKQFIDLLSDIGFVYDQYSNDMEMVCAILCAGMYPNVVQCKRRGKRTAFFTKEVGKVDIHPSSVNAGVYLFPLPYMVYSEKVKTSGIYIRDSTNISDYALLLFGGNLLPSSSGEGIEMLGGYFHFSASKSVLDLIKKLREELDRLLNRKIEEPRLDISVEGKGVVAAVVELLHSQNLRYSASSSRDLRDSGAHSKHRPVKGFK
ncbi:DExH-box ATP-dependent RNA helicase DExH1-like protein [Drosera capensis]